MRPFFLPQTKPKVHALILSGATTLAAKIDNPRDEAARIVYTDWSEKHEEQDHAASLPAPA